MEAITTTTYNPPCLGTAQDDLGREVGSNLSIEPVGIAPIEGILRGCGWQGGIDKMKSLRPPPHHPPPTFTAAHTTHISPIHNSIIIIPSPHMWSLSIIHYGPTHIELAELSRHFQPTFALQPTHFVIIKNELQHNRPNIQHYR